MATDRGYGLGRVGGPYVDAYFDMLDMLASMDADTLALSPPIEGFPTIVVKIAEYGFDGDMTDEEWARTIISENATPASELREVEPDGPEDVRGGVLDPFDPDDSGPEEAGE
jgi:hypothetical protein